MQQEISTKKRCELANAGALSTQFRDSARTHPDTAVRSAFAEREDLTQAEISAILTGERNSQVTAKLLGRRLDSAVLSELLRSRRVAVMESLLASFARNGVLDQPESVAALIAWADEREMAGRLTNSQLGTARKLMRSLRGEHIDGLDQLPESTTLRDGLSANEHVWSCRRREEILEAAATAGGWAELGNSVHGLTDEYPLNEHERELLSTIAHRLGGYNGRSLKEASMNEQSRIKAAEEEARRAGEREATKARLRALIDSVRRCEVSEEALLATAREFERVDELDCYKQELLQAVLSGYPQASEAFLEQWSGPSISSYQLNPERIEDPSALLSWLASGRPGHHFEYEWILCARAVAMSYQQSPHWEKLSSTIARTSEAVAQTHSSHALGSIVNELAPVTWMGMSCEMLSSFAERDSMPQLARYIVDQLGGICERSGTDAASVQAMFEGLWGTPATLAEVLAGVEEALSI